MAIFSSSHTGSERAESATGSETPHLRDRFGAPLKTTLRVVGLAAIVVFFLRKNELLGDTSAVLERIDWSAYAFGVFLYVAGLATGALRLRLIVETSGRSVPLSRLFIDLIKSTGLNALITPGAGEIYRVGRLRAEGLQLSEASTLILADRAIGLAVVCLTGLAGAIALGAEWTGSGSSALIVVAAGLVVAAALAACLRYIRPTWEASLRKLIFDRRTFAGILAVSVPTLLLWITSVFAFARALELNVEFFVVAFAAPIVTVATLVPISVGGIGIREAGYALLLAPYGVTAGEAVALGLLQYSSFLLVASIAWILLFFDSLDRTKHLGAPTETQTVTPADG